MVSFSLNPYDFTADNGYGDTTYDNTNHLSSDLVVTNINPITLQTPKSGNWTYVYTNCLGSWQLFNNNFGAWYTMTNLGTTTPIYFFLYGQGGNPGSNDGYEYGGGGGGGQTYMAQTNITPTTALQVAYQLNDVGTKSDSFVWIWGQQYNQEGQSTNNTKANVYVGYGSDGTDGNSLKNTGGNGGNGGNSGGGGSTDLVHPSFPGGIGGAGGSGFAINGFAINGSAGNSNNVPYNDSTSISKGTTAGKYLLTFGDQTTGYIYGSNEGLAGNAPCFMMYWQTS